MKAFSRVRSSARLLGRVKGQYRLRPRVQVLEERFLLALTFNEFPLLETVGPTDIMAGPGDALWFGSNNGKIGKINTDGTGLHEFDTGSSGVWQLTLGADQKIW